MAENTNNEIIAFGMTRQDVIDVVTGIKREYSENDEDSSTYSEYAQAMKKGREALKNSGYYPYLPAEVK